MTREEALEVLRSLTTSERAYARSALQTAIDSARIMLSIREGRLSEERAEIIDQALTEGLDPKYTKLEDAEASFGELLELLADD